jgi:hypothetical protein
MLLKCWSIGWGRKRSSHYPSPWTMCESHSGSRLGPFTSTTMPNLRDHAVSPRNWDDHVSWGRKWNKMLHDLVSQSTIQISNCMVWTCRTLTKVAAFPHVVKVLEHRMRPETEQSLSIAMNKVRVSLWINTWCIHFHYHAKSARSCSFFQKLWWSRIMRQKVEQDVTLSLPECLPKSPIVWCEHVGLSRKWYFLMLLKCWSIGWGRKRSSHYPSPWTMCESHSGSTLGAFTSTTMPNLRDHAVSFRNCDGHVSWGRKWNEM